MSEWGDALAAIYAVPATVVAGWPDSGHPIFDALVIEQGGQAMNDYCLTHFYPQRYVTGIIQQGENA